MNPTALFYISLSAASSLLPHVPWPTPETENDPTPTAPARPYGHKLIWTVLFALVFSAGLIAGQRVMQSDKHMPLVSMGQALPKATAKAPEKKDTQGAGGVAKKIDFSFHDRLNPTKEPAKAAARYTLQVGSYPELSKAKATLKTLRAQGLEVHLVSLRLKSGVKTHRVRLGKFDSMAEARQFREELVRQGSTLKMAMMPL